MSPPTPSGAASGGRAVLAKREEARKATCPAEDWSPLFARRADDNYLVGPAR